ncbi:hypothetical protein [Pseudaquabacterium rugosum]|uniref:Tetratricopeptide repeat protein n=1 Tax=Pseudaquabacterium rugosum TaxID=2984194 RepID=A0ABU9B6L9_9BURK
MPFDDLPAPPPPPSARTRRASEDPVAPRRGGRALPEGEALGALRTALDEQRVALAHGHPIVVCEALTQTARCLAALHAYAEAEASLASALAALRQMPGAADAEGDLLCALAEICCNEADQVEALEDDAPEAQSRRRAARARARDWADGASRLALLTSDPGWGAILLMRAADVLERGGDIDDAVTLQRQALALSEPRRSPSRWAQPEGLRHAAPTVLM